MKFTKQELDFIHANGRMTKKEARQLEKWGKILAISMAENLDKICCDVFKNQLRHIPNEPNPKETTD